jgi:hypothetical protein
MTKDVRKNQQISKMEGILRDGKDDGREVTGAYQKPTSSTTTKHETETGSSKSITAGK